MSTIKDKHNIFTKSFRLHTVLKGKYTMRKYKNYAQSGTSCYCTPNSNVADTLWYNLQRNKRA